MQRYDLLVVGGGSGGIAAAVRAAAHGARVALFEPAELGGTCVNRGCVPKKLSWQAAAVLAEAAAAGDWGARIRVEGLDWADFKARREAYLARLRERYRERLEEAGVSWIPAPARLCGRDGVEADGRRYHGGAILVATGSRPVRPAVPGCEHGIDSDGFFALEALPRRVAVVGGGYIGVELAGMLCAFGVEVTLLTRGVRLLGRFDDFVVEALTEAYRRQGIAVHTGARLRALRRAAGGLALELEDRALGGLDAVLWATGRRPNSDGLGLEALGVERDAAGHIVTDPWGATAVPGLYAVGDVAGGGLTPVAIAAGRRLADRLFGGASPPPVDPEQVPTVVFAHPPLAAVGLTEEQARRRHGDAVRVHQARFTPLAQALAQRPLPAAVKLVVGPEDRVLGVHACGPGADELIQGFAVALGLGARKADFDRTVAVHPTLAEELVTLR